MRPLTRSAQREVAACVLRGTPLATSRSPACSFHSAVAPSRPLRCSPPSSSSSEPSQKKRSSRNRGARANLNPFSQEVRRLLTSSSTALPQSGCAAACEQQEAAILSALSAQPLACAADAHIHAACVGTSSMLHPLLCIRILQCLGFPLLPADSAAGKGWLVRHRSTTLAHEEAVQRVLAHVLCPLQPLLGAAPSGPDEAGRTDAAMHPQLQPVLPLALAWWCLWRQDVGVTEGRLSSEVWVPHLLGFYRNYLDRNRQCAKPPVATTTSQEEEGSPAVAPLPLSFLLPFFLPKFTHVGTSEQPEALSEALALCLQEDTASSTPSLPIVFSSPGYLADSLFWSTSIPLLAHPVLQSSLHRAAERATAAAVDAADRGDGKESTKGYLIVRIAIDNDKTFRRFLLRLTSLLEHQRQHQQRGTGTQREAASNAWPPIYIEPFVSMKHALSPDGGGGSEHAEAVEDNVLRWINPLHDFISTVYADRADGKETHRQTAEMVELSFTGLLNVLTAILDRLQTLRKQSSCDVGPQKSEGDPMPSETQSFPLLAHKPRVHTIKRVCEILLHHCRRVLATQEGVNAGGVSRNEGVVWFHDVAVPQQEAVLRRLCGVSRALVRVAMEEKRVSLLTEGPEGSALTAGGAVGGSQPLHSRDTRGSTPVAEGKEGTGSEPSGSASIVPHPSSSLSASLTAVSQALRNTAFRVLEPDLWRYYQVDAEAAATPSPLGVTPSLSVLLRVAPLHLLSKEVVLASDFASGETHSVGEDARDVQGWVMEGQAAVRQVYRDVGGAGAASTALALLRHPLQQPAAAVMEGVRLLALHVLLFSQPLVSYAKENGDCCTPLEHAAPRLVDRLELAVQSVWDACGEDTKVEAAAEAEDASKSSAGLVRGTELQVRLALLSLVVLVRAGVAALERGSTGSVGTPAHEGEGYPANADQLLTTCQALIQAATKGGEPGAEWGLVGLDTLLPGTEAAAVYVGPSSTTSRWELVESLRDASAGEEGSEAVWEWLGSPPALVRAAREVHEQRDHAHKPPRLPHYLVPWTTLAESRQPLRLYDESRQSAGEAADFFDHHLQMLLQCACPNSAAGADADPVVVVRFVSLHEELTFFAPLACRAPVLRLTPDIVVENPELKAALSMHKSLLAAVATTQRNEHSPRGPREGSASAGPFDANDEEDDYYDGLD